jgi:hypothetical protein
MVHDALKEVEAHHGQASHLSGQAKVSGRAWLFRGRGEQEEE